MQYTKTEAKRIAYFGAVKISKPGSGYTIARVGTDVYNVQTPDGANVYGVTLDLDGQGGTCSCAFYAANEAHRVCKHITACQWVADAEPQTELDFDAEVSALIHEARKTR